MPSCACVPAAACRLSSCRSSLGSRAPTGCGSSHPTFGRNPAVLAWSQLGSELSGVGRLIFSPLDRRNHCRQGICASCCRPPLHSMYRPSGRAGGAASFLSPQEFEALILGLLSPRDALGPRLRLPARRHRRRRARDVPGCAPQARAIPRRQCCRLAVPHRSARHAQPPTSRLVTPHASIAIRT